MTSAIVGRICTPGLDRVKVSENLGATGLVAPVDTSLHSTLNVLSLYNVKKNMFTKPLSDIIFFKMLNIVFVFCTKNRLKMVVCISGM